MADEEELEFDGETEEGESKGKKGIILLLLLVLLIGAGAGLYFTGMLDSFINKEETEVAEVVEGEEAKPASTSKKEPLEVLYYELPEIMVNLSPGSATPSFAKMDITIEVESQEVVTKLEAVKPKIMDVINTYVRELRPGDLKGSAGIQRLREEVMMRINKTIDPHEISNVLFTEILIQ